MTESLADGPDWHLRSRFCSGLSLFSAVDEWSGSSIVVPMDSILEDKELMKMHVGLQKTFPDIPCVSQMHGRPFFAARRYEGRPQHPFKYRMRWE